MAQYLGTSDQLLKTSPQKHIQNRKQERKTSKDILQFPKNLGAHSTLMRFFQYTYGGGKGSVEEPLATVVLPLPKQIQDSFKINVAGDELGVTGSIAAQVAKGAGGEGMTDALKKFADASTTALESVGAAGARLATGDFTKFSETLSKTADAAGFLTQAGLSKVGADLGNGIGAGRGNAVNPFQTLVFKGVDLKVHSLEWLLSPENEEEQTELKNIIQTIQRMVLPKTEKAVGGADSGLTAIDKGILKYPAMVNIYLQGLDQDYFFKFKTSMISQLNIDYTPEGVALNRGGKPNAVRITMTLNEAYIHTSADYGVNELVDQEFVDEQFVGGSAEDDDATRPPPINPDNTYASDFDFTDLQAEDEVGVKRILPDGTEEVNYFVRGDLESAGVSGSTIDSGTIPGDDTTAFVTSDADDDF